MHYLFQFLIIGIFCFFGELLNFLLPFPIPASIYGMVLLLLALLLKIVKPDSIHDSASFFIAIMPCFFIMPCVSLINVWSSIAGSMPAILTIVFISTCVVMAVTGGIAQFFIRKGGK
ncbi:MAG: CidA/LrgA family protein [Lachnospiraceae bacterium]